MPSSASASATTRSAARNPRLIYAIVTGYGLEGPDANRAAYDIAAFWARSGIASLLTAPDSDPPFQRGGMGDHSVGLSTAAAISAALFARERTGEGQMVSTSLLRQGVYTIGFDLNMVLGWGLTTAVGTRHAMGNPAINNYSAGDGRRFWIVASRASGIGRPWRARWVIRNGSSTNASPLPVHARRTHAS
jgi:crotonobetainyl-CoA:carnitine CoA-transferase CaiB-like acyl-CoA transferase